MENIINDIKNGDIEAIQNKISNGLNINDLIDDCGNTMLIKASFYDKEDVVKFLKDSGADVSMSNKYGITFYQLEFAKNTGTTMKKMYMKNKQILYKSWDQK